MFYFLFFYSKRWNKHIEFVFKKFVFAYTFTWFFFNIFIIICLFLYPSFILYKNNNNKNIMYSRICYKQACVYMYFRECTYCKLR